MDESRINELFEEAIIDCYDEEEQFSGIFHTLLDELDFPLKATFIGEQVAVTGFDNASSLRRGIVATVQRNGQTYQAGLTDLTFVEPSESTREWLTVYNKWTSY